MNSDVLRRTKDTKTVSKIPEQIKSRSTSVFSAVYCKIKSHLTSLAGGSASVSERVSICAKHKQRVVSGSIAWEHKNDVVFDAFFMMMVNWFDTCHPSPKRTPPNYFSTEIKIDGLFSEQLIQYSIEATVVNLSSGFGMTFLISISLMAAAFFSALSALWWDRDDAGSVAMLSPLSTSTVATLTSLSTPIGSLKFQLKVSKVFLGIFTTFFQRSAQPNSLSTVHQFVLAFSRGRTFSHSHSNPFERKRWEFRCKMFLRRGTMDLIKFLVYVRGRRHPWMFNKCNKITINIHSAR